MDLKRMEWRLQLFLSLDEMISASFAIFLLYQKIIHTQFFYGMHVVQTSVAPEKS